MMSDTTRAERAAERRKRVTLRWSSLGGEPPDDDIRGARAISLVAQLTRESWALGGRPWPAYIRAETPYRFVRGWPE